jgi:hypothetical protein
MYRETPAASILHPCIEVEERNKKNMISEQSSAHKVCESRQTHPSDNKNAGIKKYRLLLRPGNLVRTARNTSAAIEKDSITVKPMPIGAAFVTTS